MKAFLIVSGTGPMVFLTSHDMIVNPDCLKKMKAKGINKFMAYELPVDLVKEKYGGHFSVVITDLHESDDLRVLDYNGHRVFDLFSLKALGEPVVYDQE